VPRVHPILGPAALVLWLTAMAAGAPLWAQEIEGVEIEPLSGTYVVLKDANVRARPETRSKKIGRFDAGEKVEARGRVKGPWLAVMIDDKTLGFVYGPILMPVIDGTLADPLKGGSADGTCNYVLEFQGKTGADHQRFEFADYSAEWRCEKDGASLRFHTPMFLTEGPHQGTEKPVHQITVDLLDLVGGLEEVFSLHFLWDRDKKNVRYDSTTVKKFVHSQAPEPVPVEDLSAALMAALRLAAEVWTPAVWTALAKR